MSEAEDALRVAVDHWMATNRPAESALFGLIVAGTLVVASFTYRLPPWWAAAVRGAGLVVAIVVLGVQVSHGGWLTTVDQSVTAWVAGHRNPTADHIALAITSVFGPTETVGGAVMAAVVIWLAAESWPAGLTTIAVVGGASFTCWLTTLLVARGRPPMSLQEILATDYSFPSGHVTGTTAFVGIIAVVFGVHRGRTVQIMLSAIAALVISVVGISCVYLGMHWLADVVAGALLGALAVTIGAASSPRLRARRRRDGVGAIGSLTHTNPTTARMSSSTGRSSAAATETLRRSVEASCRRQSSRTFLCSHSLSTAIWSLCNKY